MRTPEEILTHLEGWVSEAKSHDDLSRERKSEDYMAGFNRGRLVTFRMLLEWVKGDDGA